MTDKPDGRWLRRNHGCGHPTNIMCLSAVAWENKTRKWKEKSTLHFRAGHIKAFRLEKGCRTRCINETVNFREKVWFRIAKRVQERKPLWVFAYDLPKVFTLLGGWQRWRRGEFGIQPQEVDYIDGKQPVDMDKKLSGFFCDNDPPVIAVVYHQYGGKVVFCDVRNYYNMTLDKVSEGVGKPFSTYCPESATIHLAKAEASRQCAVVADAMCGLITRHKQCDLGNWGHTSAALGWNAYRHRFMRNGICIHSIPKVDDLERDSYYGGWTEAKRIGKITDGVTQLDVNALYPAVMAVHRLPCELELSSEMGHRHGGDIWRNPLDYIADVRIVSVSETFPKRSDRYGTIQATGRFYTTLAGPELRRAIEGGFVHHIGRWTKYKRADLFSGHVAHFWRQRIEARKNGDFLGDALAKSCVNSLYGRFARRSAYWEPLSKHATWNAGWKILTPSEQTAYLIMTGNDMGKQIALAGPSFPPERMIRQVGRHWQVRAERKTHPNAFVAIAAYITSFGREAMRALCCQLGWYNVWRIATDSLTVNSAGLLRAHLGALIDPDTIGKLKVEYSADGGEFWSVHHWRIGDHICHGSIRDDAHQIPDGRYVERQVQRLASLIKTGWKGSLNVRTVTKKPPEPTVTGGIEADGRLKPIVLQEF